MKLLFVSLILLLAWHGSILAHEEQITDLKKVSADHQVKAVRYCKGQYEVQLKDGSARQFQEFDLRFKTDSGRDGPKPGSPALIKAGMAGDRAFVIFSGPEEMKDFVKKSC